MPYRVTPASVKGKMNILLYGRQGVGKTILAATAQDHEDMKDVLFLNTDRGLVSIASRNDIDADDIESTEQLEQIFWKIINKDPEYTKYRTVVIDSINELQEINLLERVQESITKKGAQGKRSVDERYQEDYGKSTAMLHRIFRMFRDAPVNVILIGLSKEIHSPNDVDKKLGPIEILPALTPKLGNALMGAVDFVWFLTAKEDAKTSGVTRYLLTRDSGVYRAKTRGIKFAEALGLYVTNPNLSELYNLYVETEEKQNAK